MATRYDVSTVAPQGAYIAKRCPVRIQNDVLRPVAPLPPSEEAQLRMRQGVEFEAVVFDQLRRLGRPGWVFLGDELDKTACIAATRAALEDGAELIAGGFLPVDETGRRTGRPDLLIRAACGGYVPVDVKHHRTLEVDAAGTAETSPLGDPFPSRAGPRTGWARVRHKGDALQLGHYRRMLEAFGWAAETMRAGIIGKELEVVWYDLDAPLWQTPAKSDGRKRKTRTTMEIYDFEFDFRLDIGAVAQRHVEDPSVDLLVAPLRCGECADCPWREHCDAALLAGAGDPSLLPRVGFREWSVLRDGGVTDRARVAALHHPTARLAAGGVELDRLLGEANALAPHTEVAALVPRSKKQQGALAGAGIVTVGDLRRFVDSATAAVAGGGFLPGAILHARAAVGEAPVYRLPGSAPQVPRAGIEVDVDMENTNDGTYLWGVLVTDRSGSGLAEPGYRPFVTWEPLTPEVELDVFRRFWEWLADLIARAGAAAVDVAAYCWHESAENRQMRRIAAADPALTDAVEEFLASDRWVDLRRVFTKSWITGESTGLKLVAPLAGYAWPVEGPGGGMAMVRHAAATADPPDVDARRWLLEYNRGDVEATLAIRRWLDAAGAGWPEVAVD